MGATQSYAWGDKKFDYDVVNGVMLMKLPTQTKPIPETVNQKLRNTLSLKYSYFLLLTIKQFSHDKNLVDACSESLSIPDALVFDKDGNILVETETNKGYTRHYLRNPYFKKKDIDEAFEKFKLKYPTNVDSESSKAILKYIDSNNLGVLQKEYQKCKHFQYFIPFATYGLFSKSGHQNLLLFNKNEKRVTWIEPHGYTGDIDPRYSEKRQELMSKSIKMLLKYLHGYNSNIGENEGQNPAITKYINQYEIDLPSKQCPQAIAEDKNCMFWTLVLTLVLVDNPNATIDEVSTAILQKYPTQEALSAFMNDFKWFIAPKWFFTAGKRRTLRRKPRTHKRR